MANPQQNLKQAQRLLASGSPAKAESLARTLLDDETLFLASRILLSKALVEQGNLTEAAQFTIEVAQSAPDNPSLQVAAGDLLERIEQFDEAAFFIQRALGIDPSNATLWHKMLRIMLSGLRTEADRKSEESPSIAITALFADDPEQDTKAALPVPDSLIQLASKALTSFSDNMDITTIVGEIFFEAGLTEPADLCFERVLSARPYLPKIHHKWLKRKHLDKAYLSVIDYSQKHGEAVAKDALCQRVIAAAYENMGQFDVALDHLDRALRLEPGNQEYIAARGRVCFYMGRFDEALDDLNNAITRDPEDRDSLINRCLTLKCQGNIKASAKDEWARIGNDPKNPYFDFDIPLWRGGALEGKRLMIWSDMGVGDAFKFAPLIHELPKDGHIIFMTQEKTLSFMRQILPDIDVRPLPKVVRSISNGNAQQSGTGKGKKGVAFKPIPLDFDWQMDLGSLYTILRPDLASFAGLTKSHQLPEAELKRFANLDCLSGMDVTRVGLAWSSKNRNPINDRLYIALEDLLPLLRMPGFAFYNLQYSATEEEIDAFRKEHNVPIYHAPGLDLFDDMLGTAAFTAQMDLYISPANTCADIAGSMGVKSYRFDLINLPEPLGQDHIPWYIDQKSTRIPWGKSICDYIPMMQQWLIANKDHRGSYRDL